MIKTHSKQPNAYKMTKSTSCTVKQLKKKHIIFSRHNYCISVTKYNRMPLVVTKCLYRSWCSGPETVASDPASFLCGDSDEVWNTEDLQDWEFSLENFLFSWACIPRHFRLEAFLKAWSFSMYTVRETPYRTQGFQKSSSTKLVLQIPIWSGSKFVRSLKLQKTLRISALKSYSKVSVSTQPAVQYKPRSRSRLWWNLKFWKKTEDISSEPFGEGYCSIRTLLEFVICEFIDSFQNNGLQSPSPSRFC